MSSENTQPNDKSPAVPDRAGRLRSYWHELTTNPVRQDQLVLGLLVAERFLTRLFSEKLGWLPGWTNFLDYPLLIVLAGYVYWRTRSDRLVNPHSGFEVPAILLVLIIGGSAVLNLDRLHAPAVVLFAVGLLEPIAYLFLILRLKPDRAVLDFVIKILLGIGWLQLLTVLVLDIPVYLESGDPDVISGTFGENAYQLVFFLLTWNALILSRAKAQGRKLIATVPIQFVTLLIILLAQFRAFIPSVFLTWGMTYFLIYGISLRTLRMSVIGVSSVIGLFLLVNLAIPSLKYQEVIELASRSDEVIQSGKVQTVLAYGRLVSDQPQILLVGTGPGTMLSRGFRVFSVYGEREMVNQLLEDRLGIEPYLSDVAETYILPITAREFYAFGSQTTTDPWISHLAVLTELGLGGFLVVMLMYWRALRVSLRPKDGSALHLGRWLFIAIIVLLQLAFLGEWLEVTRLTIPIWLVLGLLLSDSRSEQIQDAAGA
jgi:hypothetical protein